MEQQFPVFGGQRRSTPVSDAGYQFLSCFFISAKNLRKRSTSGRPFAIFPHQCGNGIIDPVTPRIVLSPHGISNSSGNDHMQGVMRCVTVAWFVLYFDDLEFHKDVYSYRGVNDTGAITGTHAKKAGQLR